MGIHKVVGNGLNVLLRFLILFRKIMFVLYINIFMFMYKLDYVICINMLIV